MHWLVFGLAWELWLAQVSLCRDTWNGYTVLSPLQLLPFIPAGLGLPLQPLQGSSVRIAWWCSQWLSKHCLPAGSLGEVSQAEVTGGWQRAQYDTGEDLQASVRGGHVEPGVGRQSVMFSVQNVRISLKYPLSSRCYIRAVVLFICSIYLYCKYILAQQHCNS